jgi:hypothetical protein
MKSIELKRGIACKCSNRAYTGSNGLNYWYNYISKIIYSTDPHKYKNPKRAIGSFILDGIKINQL